MVLVPLFEPVVSESVKCELLGRKPHPQSVQGCVHINVTFPAPCIPFAFLENHLAIFLDLHPSPEQIPKCTKRVIWAGDVVRISNASLCTNQCRMKEREKFKATIAKKFVTLNQTDGIFGFTKKRRHPDLGL